MGDLLQAFQDCPEELIGATVAERVERQNCITYFVEKESKNKNTTTDKQTQRNKLKKHQQVTCQPLFQKKQ